MKVGELIKILENVSPNFEVYVPCTTGEHDYNLVQSAKPRFLTIEESEDYPDETLVFIIDEL